VNLADAAAWKSYFWPGSYILRNRLGIRDANKLAEAEALLTNQRLEEGVPAAPATPDGYRSIHQFIFQDIYDWAGEYRTANMRHPNHFALFCKKEFIAAQMTLVFDPLRALPAGSLVSPQSVASALAKPMGDLNAIHPFREGNGRTMRVFIDQFARIHGFRFDQTKLDAA
jgi:cell filamentation protein